MRLDRLYIAEGLELSIAVQFSRDLSDDEAKQVQWTVADDAGVELRRLPGTAESGAGDDQAERADP